MEKEIELGMDCFDFGARIYDARLSKWFSTDPLQKKYAPFSPYCFVENNPLIYKDLDGKDKWLVITVTNEQTGTSQTFSVKVSDELMSDVTGAWRDGNGHGNPGDRNFYDININFNITVDKNGKVNTTLTQNKGIFRVSVGAGLSAYDDEKYARIKMALNDGFNDVIGYVGFGDPVKQADIGEGFYYTSENVKGQGDPYYPGAKKITTIKNADALLLMLSKGGGILEAPPQLQKELSEMNSKSVDNVVKALIKALETAQNHDQVTKILEENSSKPPNVEKTVFLEKTGGLGEGDSKAHRPSGSNKTADTTLNIKYVPKPSNKKF